MWICSYVCVHVLWLGVRIILPWHMAWGWAGHMLTCQDCVNDLTSIILTRLNCCVFLSSHMCPARPRLGAAPGPRGRVFAFGGGGKMSRRWALRRASHLGAFHQALLTTVVSYWNPCIWLAESKFVSEKQIKRLMKCPHEKGIGGGGGGTLSLTLFFTKYFCGKIY